MEGGGGQTRPTNRTGRSGTIYRPKGHNQKTKTNRSDATQTTRTEGGGGKGGREVVPHRPQELGKNDKQKWYQIQTTRINCKGVTNAKREGASC